MSAFKAERALRWLGGLLAVMWYAGWITTALLTALAIVDAANGPARGAPLINLTQVGIVLPDSMREVTSSTWRFGYGEVDSIEAVVDVDNSPWSFKLVILLGWYISIALTLFWVRQLRKVVARVREGAPFDAENARRLRLVGIAMILTFVVDLAYVLAASWLMARNVTLQGATLTPMIDPDWAAFFFALVVLALPDIFARGAQLEEDQALTV